MTRNELIGVALGGGVLLAASLGLGVLLGRRDDGLPAAPGVAAPAGQAVLYWYDPMVPDQHFAKPGKSPFMDMQLVPKYANGEDTAGVSINPAVQQNLGVRTVVVGRGQLQVALRVPGTVGWNLREERVLSLPVDAVIERLYVRTPFETVRAGQMLMSVRSPAWGTAIAEAQALRGARSTEGRALQSLTSGRLRALGLPTGARTDGQGAIVLTAPVSGVVSEIGVREGQATTAGMPLLRVNGTRTVWVEASLPPGAAARNGTTVEVSADSLPGVALTGKIDALLPQVDASTRTQRARIVLDNPDGQLAPGMFVQVALQPGAGRDAVLVPSGAVIADGTQLRVIVRNATGGFSPVVVRAGGSGAGMTEIVSGLSGGERVVASGQFLIDSEANLTGALDRLDPAKQDAATPNVRP